MCFELEFDNTVLINVFHDLSPKNAENETWLFLICTPEFFWKIQLREAQKDLTLVLAKQHWSVHSTAAFNGARVAWDRLQHLLCVLSANGTELNKTFHGYFFSLSALQLDIVSV